MQVFLPYSDYGKTAKCLYQGHPGHLGDQFYREGKTLLFGGWKNHPASKMWTPYLYSLCDYLECLYIVLKEDYGKDYSKQMKEILDFKKTLPNTGKPHFVGDEKFHASHRSNLLRRDKEKGWNWYSQFNWSEPDDLPYLWPIKEEEYGL